jgi:LysR family transcriptional regulator, glycine cleavage system transcriptional activator
VQRLAKFGERHPVIKVRLVTSNEPLEALQDPYEVIIRGGPDSFYGYEVCPFLSEAAARLQSGSARPVAAAIAQRFTARLWNDWLTKAGVVDLNRKRC